MLQPCRLSANLKLCRKRRHTAVNPGLHQSKPPSKSQLEVEQAPPAACGAFCSALQVRSNKKLAKARPSFNHRCYHHCSELLSACSESRMYGPLNVTFLSEGAARGWVHVFAY